MRLAPLALALCLAGLSSAAFGNAADIEGLLKVRDPGALAKAQAFVETNEANARAWVLLARAQLQKGEADEAVESAEQAVELAPNDAQAQLWLGNSLGVRIGQVNMLRKMGMAPDLRDAFEAAVRLDGNLLDARSALIGFYLQAPRAMGGGVEKAQAQQREVAKRNPVRGHLEEAAIQRVHFEDNAAAMRAIDAAMAAAPALPAEDIDTRVSLGRNLVGLERYADARTYYLAWAAAQPRQAAPHYQLGRLAAISGQFLDEGSAGLKRYLDGGLARGENDPDDTIAWWRLGQIQAKQGDKATARTSFQTALRLDPRNAEAKKDLEAL
ncbi:tetratricopeptide repeat protein [Silanimonas sp.]|uniref:tetratricopeptide repeat protein n=1 Tax=Silanimonas sp. TaxID=1929290 RepID=UPI0022BE3DCC|nr:tetratricopeptide repeat protein [Silanimonas sp.]MCZ8062386.1 tetratricopeptide repeat protein [Silanimonas sp.]